MGQSVVPGGRRPVQHGELNAPGIRGQVKETGGRQIRGKAEAENHLAPADARAIGQLDRLLAVAIPAHDSELTGIAGRGPSPAIVPYRIQGPDLRPGKVKPVELALDYPIINGIGHIRPARLVQVHFDLAPYRLPPPRQADPRHAAYRKHYHHKRNYAHISGHQITDSEKYDRWVKMKRDYANRGGVCQPPLPIENKMIASHENQNIIAQMSSESKTGFIIILIIRSAEDFDQTKRNENINRQYSNQRPPTIVEERCQCSSDGADMKSSTHS